MYLWRCQHAERVKNPLIKKRTSDQPLHNFAYKSRTATTIHTRASRHQKAVVVIPLFVIPACPIDLIEDQDKDINALYPKFGPNQPYLFILKEIYIDIPVIYAVFIPALHSSPQNGSSSLFSSSISVNWVPSLI